MSWMVGRGKATFPIGRLDLGHKPNYNINVNKVTDNYFGNSGYGNMNYGGGFDMYGGGFGGYNMGCGNGYGYGCGNGALNVLGGIAALTAGFMGGYSGGSRVQEKEEPPKAQENEAFTKYMEQSNKQLEEMNKKATALANDVSKIKAASIEKQKAEQALLEEQQLHEAEDDTPFVEEQVNENPLDSANKIQKTDETSKAEDAKKIKEQQELEALKQEGITKNADGTYSASVKDNFGKNIKVSGSTADEVRQNKKAEEKRISDEKEFCETNGIKIENGKFSKNIKCNNGNSTTVSADSADDVMLQCKAFEMENKINSPAQLIPALNKALNKTDIKGRIDSVSLVSENKETGEKTVKISFKDNGIFNTYSTVITVNDLDKDFDKILDHVKNRIDKNVTDGGMF